MKILDTGSHFRESKSSELASFGMLGGKSDARITCLCRGLVKTLLNYLLDVVAPKCSKSGGLVPNLKRYDEKVPADAL